MFAFIKTKKKEIIIALISGFIALCLGTVGVEIYLQYKINKTSAIKFDSDLGWSPIPNKKLSSKQVPLFQLNSLGFRSDEIDNSKEHILVLGDSVAWGYGTKNHETFPFYLSQRNSNFQVLNMAVSGYGIGQSYLFLKKHIDKVNPKLILFVIYTGNDLHETGSNIAYGKSKPMFFPKNNEINLINNHISKFSCINLIHGSHVLKSSVLKKFKNGLCEIKTLSLDQAKQVISTLFQKISTLGLNKNVKTLFVISPSKRDLRIEICRHNSSLDYCQAFQNLLFPNQNKNSKAKGFYIKNFQSLDLKPLGLFPPLTVKSIKRLEWGGSIIFRDILKASGLNYFDYSSELAKTNLIHEQASNLYIDNAHYSAQGNKRLANSIASWLKKNRWMDN
jgi:lysophospholipase L1-like esterase